MRLQAIVALLAMAVFITTVPDLTAGDNPDTLKVELPTVHANVGLQMENYFNGDSTYFTGSARPAQDGFTIRDALVVIGGTYGPHLEYDLEVGTASCQSGGFMVMEAAILYQPVAGLKVGFSKGHVRRGFELHQECVELLTAEKPIYALKYSPCHPLGAVIEYETDPDRRSGITAQLVVAEGTGGTLDHEHDINLGLQYRTPLDGLRLAGSYTIWRWNASYSVKDSLPTPGGARDEYDYFWVAHKAVYDGYRAVIGLDYDNNNFLFRGECYLGKGFKDILDYPYYADLWADSSQTAKITGAPFEDMEMQAFFIQAGYTVPVNKPRLRYIQPYAQLQWWDQGANLVGDYRNTFLTIGVNLGLGPGNMRFKIDYQTCLAYADDGGLPPYGEAEQADRLITRLLIGL